MKPTYSIAATAGLIATGALADVQVQDFTFTSNGAEMIGTLYLPEGAEEPVPTVIVTGAWTSVQEQMPRTYALEMVQRGYAAVTFDFRGWGRSGDLPGGQRYIEDPAAKIDDLRAAIAAVDAMAQTGRLHGLGICASAGYMLDAARGNDAVASVALVAPWLQDGGIVEAVYGGAEGVADLIALSRRAAAQGGHVIDAAGPEGSDALMAMDGYYADPARGAIAAYDNRWDHRGWEGWLTYHSADAARGFDKPLAIVHSEAAAIPQGVHQVAGQPGVDVTWLEDVTQFDFYDRPGPVRAAADTAAAHFGASD